MAADALSQRARRLVARLRTPRGRVREGLVLVEGIRAVATALDAAPRVRLVVVSPRLEGLEKGAALGRRLEAVGLEVVRVSDAELAGLSDTEAPQGVLMICEEPEAAVSDLGYGRYLVLDGVQDPGNAGTMVRAAAAFGLDGVVALDRTVDLWSSKAVRASTGLAFGMPVVRCDAARALERFRSVGVEVWIADAGGTDVSTVEPPAGYALVVGNEGSGIRPEIMTAAHRSVAVPMRGPAESLNVGIAASVLLYALSRETRGA